MQIKKRVLKVDRIQLYNDAGWEYVTSKKYMYVFREREANKAVEIHTDSTLQAETIETLKKSIWRSGIAIVLTTLFMLVLTIWNVSAMTSYDLLSNNILFYIILLVIYLPLTIHWLSGMIHISSLIKRMKQGKGLQHHKPYKNKLNRSRFGNLLIVMIYLSLFIFWLNVEGTLSKADSYPEIPSEQLPVVSLTDIENVNLDQVTYQTNGIEREMQNYFLEKASILVPKQYILHQQFIIPEMDWEHDTGNYQPTIRSSKYVALSEGIAKKLVEALREEETNWSALRIEGTKWSNTESLAETKINGFDEVWLIESDTDIKIIARSDKSIYDLYYNGNQSNIEIPEMLTEIDSKLSKL